MYKQKIAIKYVYFLDVTQEKKPIKAIAVLTGTTVGNITFTQSDCGQPVHIEINLVGLTEGKHGFHVHEKGDLSQGCASLGPHYNPDKVNILYKLLSIYFRHFNMFCQLYAAQPRCTKC